MKKRTKSIKLVANPLKRTSYKSCCSILKIIRDILLCCLFGYLLFRIQTNSIYQHYYREMFGVGNLQYDTYKLNTTADSNSRLIYRSIIGEISGKKIHTSDEGIIFLANGDRGSDTWEQTGILKRMMLSGYRVLALDPPGMGSYTEGYFWGEWFIENS